MLYEKAVSKKQQRFFGIVRAAQKGTLEGEASPQVQRAASNMTKSEVKKMASTKHKGLPQAKESFATDKYKEIAKREADLKRKEDLKVKTKKESVDIDEAKYEKGASNYGKASIRNKRMFGKGGNAAPPEERGAAITVRRSRHQERRYVKKGNKYHEPGKHRPEVYGVNKPEEERKNKNVKEGTKYGLYKGDGKVKFKLYKPEKKKEKDGTMKKESIFTPLVFTVHEAKKKGLDGKACWDGYKLAGTKKKGGKTVDNCVKVDEAKIDDKKYGKGKGWDQPEGKSMTSYKARHSYLKKNPDNVRSDRNKRHSAQDVVFHGHDKVERDRKKKHFASKGVKKVKGAKTPSGGKEALKKRFQDQGAMEAYVNERLGGKGYKPYTSLTGKKVSGDWEDSDRGEGNKATRRAGGKVKAKSPTYIAHVKNKQKVKEEVTLVYEGLLSKFGKKKEKKVEKKPQKAMDAGARGRRLLQRREYKAKVSEFIPKELEDHVVYEQNPNTNLFPPGTQQKVKKVLDRGTKFMNQNPVGRVLSNIVKPVNNNKGSNYTSGGKVTNNSYEPEGQMVEGKKKGLWDNIHAKRKRGEKPAKPGDKDYPKTLNVEGAAWTKKSGKNKEGGLNEKGRKSYERENPGSDLKAPQPEGGSRKKSFCARMGGMKKKLTSSKTANDPDSRINKALRKWKCNEAKVDAGKSPEEKEKVRNKRKFGVTHNVVGHAKLRRSLHKMNRGDKKIKGDKSAWTEME